MSVLLALLVFCGQTARAQDDDTPNVVMAPSDLQGAVPKARRRSAAAPAAAENGQAATPPPQKPVCPIGNVPFLPTGFRFPAMLPDAVFSYNTIAPTTALIEEDIKYLDRVVIPRRSYLVGTVSIVHSDDRANITWTLLVTPQGCEFPFLGVALDASDGAAGVKGTLVTHKDSIAAQLAIQSVLSGAGAAAGAVAGAPIESAAISNFTGEGSQMAGQNMSKIQSLDSIDIKERTPIRVFVMRRFVREQHN